MAGCTSTGKNQNGPDDEVGNGKAETIKGGSTSRPALETNGRSGDGRGWEVNPSEKTIRYLHKCTDIPEEELRSLSGEQIENIAQALKDELRGLLTTEEVTVCLKENGFFDLPSLQEELRRDIEELQLAETRALIDFYNAECLRRGKPEEMIEVAKEDGEYPPARSN
jgi:hypothetical protein